MNKTAKVTVIIMITIIILYIILGVNSKFIMDNDIIESGDNLQSGEENNQIEEEFISNVLYDVTSLENEIIISAISSGEITKTKYVFENDKLSQIIVTEEIESGDLVNSVYEGLKQDNNINQIYSSIDLNDNIITMVLKQEYVDVFAGMSYNDIYEQTKQAMEQK